LSPKQLRESVVQTSALNQNQWQVRRDGMGSIPLTDEVDQLKVLAPSLEQDGFVLVGTIAEGGDGTWEKTYLVPFDRDRQDKVALLPRDAREFVVFFQGAESSVSGHWVKPEDGMNFRIPKRERSEMRNGEPSAAQVLTARVFAAGFLPVGVSVAMRALSRAEIGAVLDQIVPQNQRTEIRLHAQRMLFGSQAVQPNDAFVLGADLALKRGFLAAIKKVFPDVFFAVIAAGSEKVELQSWLKEQALDEVVLVAENVQQARAELLKKNAKAVVRGLAITASSEADTLSRDLPVITFTSGQLDRMLSFAGVVAEAARLAQFAKAFAASA